MKVGRGEYGNKEKQRMAKLSESLKALQNSNGKKITQAEIASATGIPQGTISRYISGKMLPKDEYLQKLADFFNVDVSYFKYEPEQKIEYFSTDHPYFNDMLKIHKGLTIDRHGVWIQHGNKLLEEQEREKQKQQALENQVTKLSDVTQQLFDYDFYDSAVSAGTGQFLNEAKRETISLPIDLPADFVIPVYGDSMEPEYHSGDYVFVKLTVDIASGDIGIFDLCGESYIKKIIIDDDRAYLHSLNSEYKDIPINTDSDFRVIGKVIGKYSEKQ